MSVVLSTETHPMFEKALEERVEVLEKRVEELATELTDVKNEREEESGLIPGAEYDFVPSVEDTVIRRGVARFMGFVDAPNDLGLSPSEWAMISDNEDEGE
jgi:hypothetical protein